MPSRAVDIGNDDGRSARVRRGRGGYSLEDDPSAVRRPTRVDIACRGRRHTTRTTPICVDDPDVAITLAVCDSPASRADSTARRGVRCRGEGETRLNGRARHRQHPGCEQETETGRSHHYPPRRAQLMPATRSPIIEGHTCSRWPALSQRGCQTGMSPFTTFVFGEVPAVFCSVNRSIRLAGLSSHRGGRIRTVDL